MVSDGGPQLGELASALSKAQAAFPKVVKDKTAKVQLKSGGEYSYRYADLASILDAVRKPLTENGLAITQGTEPGGDSLMLVTCLFHTSGQGIRFYYPLRQHERPQEMGSEITYARRYTLSALLGIASEDDDDGQAAQSAPVAAPAAPKRRVFDGPRATAKPEPPNPVDDALVVSATALAQERRALVTRSQKLARRIWGIEASATPTEEQQAEYAGWWDTYVTVPESESKPDDIRLLNKWLEQRADEKDRK